MKEGAYVLLYLSDFINIASRTRDWGERALIHHFRKRLASSILDQLASHPLKIDFLQHLIDATLDLDTSYHERQKEKNHVQEKKTEAATSSSSKQKNCSSSSQKKKNFKFLKRGNSHSSLLNKDLKLMGSKKKRILKEVLCVSIVVESIAMRPVSKELKTSLLNHKADFPAREKT
ncbi:hypothetical protein O181_089734 [Austropuccinia psidii MF-1]|uniref:Uncharacterized protein n=1 Tax=Austropuccinia psidii MF-1 TaxID=1389203 RepID=A0A9Q3IU34_9BASI|nr:hypothetical protein [Austropuccinia psidii MF-1]